jgi:hypothetical protein
MNPILIICGGKSAAQINWEWLKKQKNVDTFGMNKAYKTYEKLGFYPTYYANLDSVGIHTDAPHVQKLIKLNKIRKMFLHGIIEFEEHATYQRIDKLPQKQGQFFERATDLSTDFGEFDSWMNTGSDSIQISMMLGYKKIYFIGADGYADKIKGVKRVHGIVDEVLETPKENPNYWFPDYLEKGERFQHPKPGERLPGWKKTWLMCQKYRIEIFNLSYTSDPNIPSMNYKEFVGSLVKLK